MLQGASAYHVKGESQVFCVRLAKERGFIFSRWFSFFLLVFSDNCLSQHIAGTSRSAQFQAAAAGDRTALSKRRKDSAVVPYDEEEEEQEGRVPSPPPIQLDFVEVDGEGELSDFDGTPINQFDSRGKLKEQSFDVCGRCA